MDSSESRISRLTGVKAIVRIVNKNPGCGDDTEGTGRIRGVRISHSKYSYVFKCIFIKVLLVINLYII